MSKIGVAALAAMMGLAAWNGVRAEGKVVGRLTPELGDLKIVGTYRFIDPRYIIPLEDKVECGGRTYIVRFTKKMDESLLRKLNGKKVVMNGHLGTAVIGQTGPEDLRNPGDSKKVTVFYCTDLHAADKDDKEAVAVTLRGELSYIDLRKIETIPAFC